MEVIALWEDYIKLGQALKAAGLVESGVEAKIVIQEGEVMVNGETEFHHVMMKMLKSKSGNEIQLKAGEYQRLEFTYNMSLTNVEELDDLEVALWLQNPVTQEIYNSIFAYEYTEHCYPVNNLTLNQNEEIKTLTWETPEQGTPVCYKVYINGNVVSENETATSYEFNYAEDRLTAEVIAVYENGKTSVGVAKLFGVEENEDEEITSLETPKNINANAESTSSITLTWDKVENAESYNIYRDNVLIRKTTENNYTDEGLEYDTYYCYTVTAAAGDIESEQSEQACVKTLGETIEEISSSLLLYPNPVKNELIIATEMNVEEIAIHDIYGRTVRQQVNKTTGQQVIDVADLENGIYFINIKTDKGNIVRRFIKN